MDQLEAHTIQEYQSSELLKDAVKKYKDYCTIRRNLREAHQICSSVFLFHNDLKSGKIKLQDVANLIPCHSAAFFHAVILYCRWFGSTQGGKPKLSPEYYFENSTLLLQTHKELMELRNKYIAHNENDILGGDRVWIMRDDNLIFDSVISDFITQPWIQSPGLDMESFKKCIETVHNKIDAVKIPKYQQIIENNLKGKKIETAPNSGY
jgi:hypothetical protein